MKKSGKIIYLSAPCESQPQAAESFRDTLLQMILHKNAEMLVKI